MITTSTHQYALLPDPTGLVGIIKYMLISLLLLIINSSVFAAPVTNGVDTKATVIATELSYSTAPAGSVSGIALTTQPIVKASRCVWKYRYRLHQYGNANRSKRGGIKW